MSYLLLSAAFLSRWSIRFGPGTVSVREFTNAQGSNVKQEGVGPAPEWIYERSVVEVLPADASCIFWTTWKAFLREERRGTGRWEGKLFTHSVDLSEKISTLGRRPLVECLFGE